MMTETEYTVSITCARGLAPFLQQEVEAMGHKVRVAHETGVEIRATMHDVMLLNLWLRTAFSVMVLIDEFPCRSPDELHAKAMKIAWEKMVSPEEYVSVIARVNTPTINNSTFAGLRVKDAIVDRIAEKVGTRPDAGPNRENVVVNLFWTKDRCWLYLNTSGRKLSDRGYRRIPFLAPMQETLAAGAILATGYRGDAPLVNPMCGSGTLAIEAALIALRRAPGLLRANYGFMHDMRFDDTAWEGIRREARKARTKDITAPIIATDIDPGAIDAAKKNAETAGVHRLIDFRVCDFADTEIPPAEAGAPANSGIIIFNPEYGERMGDVNKLEATYARMGDFLKQKCAGYVGYIFTGNLDLAKRVGLRASRRIPFFNAKIDCRLLKYELYTGTREKRD